MSQRLLLGRGKFGGNRVLRNQPEKLFILYVTIITLAELTEKHKIIKTQPDILDFILFACEAV